MAVRRGQSKVYTRYHQMEERGVFASNPANAGAVDVDGNSIYKGPIEYPKMLYHPQGEMVVINAGVMATDHRTNMPILDAQGKPVYVGRVEDIKHVIVQNVDEENEYVAKGWHRHPADALRAAPPASRKWAAPPKTEAELLREEIAKLKAERDEALRAAAAGARSEASKREGARA